MVLNRLWRRITQRPLVTALILVAAVAAGIAGWVSAGGQAQSSAAVVVVPPWSVEDENFKNPMLNLGDRATALATTLVVAIQRSDVENAVLQAGATSYQVSNVATDVRDPTRTAVILITAIGPNARLAHNGAVEIINSANAILKQMQEDAGTGDPPYMAKLQVISQPQETTTFAARQVRSAAALALAALIACMVIAWAVERILERRLRSREPEVQSTLKQLLAEHRNGKINNGHSDERAASSENGRISRRHSETG